MNGLFVGQCYLGSTTENWAMYRIGLARYFTAPEPVCAAAVN